MMQRAQIVEDDHNQIYEDLSQSLHRKFEQNQSEMEDSITAMAPNQVSVG